MEQLKLKSKKEGKGGKKEWDYLLTYVLLQ